MIEPELNSTLPLNGRIEYAFNHPISIHSEVKQIIVAHEEDALEIRADAYRYVRVHNNRVYFFFDPSRMVAGSYTLSIPEGTFISANQQVSPAIESTFIVVDKSCNTNYVVSGMHGEKCKCFSIADRCQCSCGETVFSREL